MKQNLKNMVQEFDDASNRMSIEPVGIFLMVFKTLYKTGYNLRKLRYLNSEISYNWSLNDRDIDIVSLRPRLASDLSMRKISNIRIQILQGRPPR